MRKPAVIGLSIFFSFAFASPAVGVAKKAARPSKKVAAQRVAGVEMKPFDQPDEAMRFYVEKRSPDGVSPISAEQYFPAMEHVKNMPRYSTAFGARIPSANEASRAGVPLTALGTWSFLGPGNVGGRTRGLVINPTNPSIMIAGGVDGGIWRSTNAGSSWTNVADLLPNIAITTIALDPTNPNIAYAGSGEGFFNADAVRGAGIFKSTDGGVTWNHLSTTNTSDFQYVNKVVVSKGNPSHVYAATRTGIQRSLDGGTTWSGVYTTSVTAGVLDLAIRTDITAQDDVLATVGSFVQASILLNTDAGGGGTWSPVYTEANMGRTSLAIAPSQQSTIYALSASNETGNYNQGLLAVFRSTDGGNTWNSRVRNSDGNKLNTLLLTNPVAANYVLCGFGSQNVFLGQGWYGNVIAVDPADPNRVWTGGIDLFRSDDGGASWGLASYWWFNTTPNTAYAHADQHALVFHPQYDGSSNTTLFVGNDGGIFRTDNARASTSTDVCGNAPGGVHFVNLNNGYGVTQFYDGLPYPGGTTYFGGTQDNGTNRGTDAAGPNAWTRVSGGDGGYVAVDPTNTNVIFTEFTGLSIQKSTNGGSTFAPARSGIDTGDQFGFINPFFMDPSNPQTLWTGGLKMWRTTNQASSWTQVSAALCTGNCSSVSATAIAKTDPNYVLSARGSGFIYSVQNALSADSSTVWGSVRPATGYVSWLAFDPTNKNVAYATYSTFGIGHVWKSTNAGASWTNIDGSGGTGIPDIPAHSVIVDPTNSARIYVGTDLGVFTSTDGGGTWLAENTGFANVVVEALQIDGTNLFAFTHGRGAWKVPLVTGGGGNVTISTVNPTSGSTAGGTGVTITGSGFQTGAGVTFGGTSATNVVVSGSTSITCTTPAHAAGTVDVQVTNPGSGGSAVKASAFTFNPPGGGCSTGGVNLCIQSNRFSIHVNWTNRYLVPPVSGVGTAVGLTSDTGYFWFFNASNVELIIKVLDGRAVNGKFWVFYGALTDVEYTIFITDTQTSATHNYFSLNGNLQSIADTNAFPGP